MKGSTVKKKKSTLMQSLIVATGTGALLSSAAMAGYVSDYPIKHSQPRTIQITAQKESPVIIAAAAKRTTTKKTTAKKRTTTRKTTAKKRTAAKKRISR